MAETVESLVIKLRAQGINVTEKQLRRLDKQSKKTGMSMKGMIASVGGVYALGRAFASVVRVGKEFSSSQSNLASILGTTREKLGELDTTARELGASTKFTASQVTQLQTEYAKLGFTTSEIVAAQQATLDLAAATNVDLANAAEVAGQTVNAFGLGAESTGRVVNVMAASFSSSALDMEKFTNSMTYVSAVANQTGISVEATTAVLGKLADKGIDGSIAGTQLRKIFLEMGNESSKLSKKLGYTVQSEEDLFKALKQLNEEGLTTGEMMDLVGIRAVSAFSNMMQSAEGAEEMTKSITGTNKAAEMAAEQMDNLDGDLLKLTSASEGLAIEMYEELEPILRAVTQAVTSFIDFLDVGLIKSYATAIGIAGVAWLGYIAYQNAATFSVKAFRKALISTGIGILVVGLGALVNALGFFDEAAEDVENSFEGIADSVAKAGSKNKEFSQSARLLSLDWEKIYENVDNAIMTSLHLDENASKEKIIATKEKIKQIEDEKFVYDELSSGVEAYRNALNITTQVMDSNTGSSKTNVSTLKVQNDLLQDFTFNQHNAQTVLENMPGFFKDLDKSLDGYYANTRDYYARVNYNLQIKEFDAGVKLQISDLSKLDDAHQKSTVKTIFNIDATATAYNNYKAGSDVRKAETLKQMKKMLDTSSDYMSTYSRRIDGAFSGGYNDEIIKTANAFNEIETALDNAFAVLKPGEFEALLNELRVDGKLPERFFKEFHTTHMKLEEDLAASNEYLRQQEDFFVKHLEGKWAKVTESLTKGVEELDKAKQTSINTSTMTIATNMAQLDGVENMNDAHLAYIATLIAEEDANGQRIYTDEEILRLTREATVVTDGHRNSLEKKTLAQIAFMDAEDAAKKITHVQTKEITEQLLAVDAMNSNFNMTVGTIDNFVRAVEEAMIKGASFQEAIDQVTRTSEGERSDEEIAAKLQKELDIMQAFNEAAQEEQLAALELEFETQARHDQAMLTKEWEKVTQTDEYKKLLVSNDEADKKKLLLLQANYQKAKEKIEKQEELAAITKHNNIADLTSQAAGSLVSFWQATGKNAELVTNLQYVQAIADTYKAATSALANAGGWPLGIPAMTVTIVQGLAQVAQIAKAREQAKQMASKSVAAEYGANFITQGPTNLLVGDNPGGKERVSVTPITSPNMRGGGSSAPPINVSVTGNVMSKDFVEDELIDTINEAIRKGHIISS